MGKNTTWKKIIAVCLLAAICLGMLAGCHKHEYGKWTTEERASCTQEGLKVRECECGEEETQVIPMKDHSYEEEVVKLPGCEGDGKTVYTCSKCDDSYEETQKVKVYSSTELYEQVHDSVGEIVVYDKNKNQLGLGTGFVAVSNDRVFTNYHVIEGAYSATISFGDKVYQVEKVLAYDVDIDLAVLQLEGVSLEMLPICEKNHAVGAPVYALGNSRGLTSTFSDGMITAALRESEGVKYVQHDAPISGGNSGGPLFNEYGEVVGINTLTLLDSQNLNFAIHMSELQNLSYGSTMTLAQVAEKENNAYNKIYNYVLTNGQEDDGFYWWDLGKESTDSGTAEWWASFDQESGDLDLWMGITIEGVEITLMVTLDQEVSGKYGWLYMDNLDNAMKGTVDGKTYTADTVLTYQFEEVTTGLTKEQVQTFSSLLMAMLWSVVTESLEPCGVSAQDLGFVNF